MSRQEPITAMYRAAMAVSFPAVRLWGRLEVSGLECLPPTGPLLLAGNHDSYWDTVSVGIGALGRRQVRALAKAELWKTPGLGPVLNGMGQIPLRRGASDQEAFERAVAELRAGACIGIFPEGTRSRGEVLRARSGFGRLAALVPEAEVRCVAIQGTTDIPRFPKRPHVKLEFFAPSGGGLQPGEEPGGFSQRILDELRAKAPRVKVGR